MSPLLDQIETAVEQALVGSLHQGFVAVLILSGLVLLVSLFLKDVPCSEKRAQQEEEKIEQRRGKGGVNPFYRTRREVNFRRRM